MRDRFSNNKKDSYSPESKGGGIETDSSIRYFLRRPVEPVGEYSVSGRALVSGMYRTWRKVGGGRRGKSVGNGSSTLATRQLTFAR